MHERSSYPSFLVFMAPSFHIAVMEFDKNKTKNGHGGRHQGGVVRTEHHQRLHYRSVSVEQRNLSSTRLLTLMSA